MSIRRLAPEDRQPPAFAFSADNETWARREIGKYPPGRQASAVIPLLWRAQEQDGWVTQAAIEQVGRMLDMPRIRVLEIATFYTMFNLEPVGKYFVQLCGTTPCELRGANAIKQVCRERIGEQDHVTADGLFSWLEVECLGACCNAPMVQINQDYYEDLTPENFKVLLDDLAAGRPVKVGPQSERHGSEPAGGLTTLTEGALFDGSVVDSWRKGFDERFEKAAAAKAEAARAAEAAKTAAQPPVAAAAGQAATPAGAATSTGQVAAAAPARPSPSSGGSNATQDTPAAGGQAVRPELATNAGGAPAAGAPSTPTAAPAVAPVADPAREELARREEQEIAARVAALPRTATATEKADAVGSKPIGLAAARNAAPDDLKRIRGIGPVNERKLHELGIFHFDQIAAWDRPQIRWVGTYLAFPGRIDREDWVGQARSIRS